MKRIILLLLVAQFVFSSCENTEDNSPGFQSQVDEAFFKASDIRGQLNLDRTLDIQGVSLDEKITLHLEKIAIKTHKLGGGSINYATFEDANGNVYSTSPFGSGEVKITGRCVSCDFISGEFYFTAVNPGVDTITVQKGFFYKVSFLNGQVDGDGNTTTSGTITARANGEDFEATTVSALQDGTTLKVQGFTETENITLEVPVNVPFGNYDLPLEGFRASYTNDQGQEEALTGRITVSFNNPAQRAIKLLFNFDTENNTVIQGDARIDY